jgi:phage tail sheath protein FI
MAEYLSPGVYIEELPPQLRAIEGVSTSTAGFVGPAERGPVPGFLLPFTPTNGFVLPRDPALVLVTSFADFTRQFGNPLPIPTPTDDVDYGYLAYAVRAFFDNGGQRCYIARVVHSTQPPDQQSAAPSSLRLLQGVVLHLARPARSGDTTVVLNSLRGVKANSQLHFLPRADVPAPAIVIGTAAAPFALAPGDQISVSVNGGAAMPMTAVAATAATVTTSNQNFAIHDGDTLLYRVGPASEPARTLTFHAADITPGAATAAQVAAAMARDMVGVQVQVAGNAVELRTDVRGSNARLEIVGGTAEAALGLATGFTAGSGNVADVDHVAIAEIVGLLAPSGFSAGDDGSGHLRLASTATGPQATLQVIDTKAGTAAKLGLAITTATGSAPAPLSVTVTAYDTRRNRVTLGAPLPANLDPNEVYAITDLGGRTMTGPQFFARNPGKWSAQLSIMVTPADRAAVPVTAAADGSANTVQVQSATSFYKGAIIEVDHGTQRSYHEITDISGTILTLVDTLGTAVTTSSLVRVMEINLTVIDASGASPTETYQGLSWNQSGNADRNRHYATQININSNLVYVQPPDVGIPALVPPGSEDATLLTQPTTADGFPASMTVPGADGLPAKSDDGDADYVGTDLGPGQRTGIQALIDADDISIIAAPGKTTATVQNALITQCANLRYRFAVLDGEENPPGGSVASILAHRSLYDTSYAAYYTPWLAITVGSQTVYLPPSGYVAGIFARVDGARGVWKAPANEVVLNVTGLRLNINKGEQDVLNPVGVNCIRQFSNRGIVVWGARTLSSDPSVRYVNVRRFLIYLEHSLDRGTQWVVFEPNSPDTWAHVVDSVSAFLNTQWRNGALFGLRPEDAYYVRCDESTMTADDVQNGRLICMIGVAIVRPAEFVIFRIEQLTGYAKQA